MNYFIITIDINELKCNQLIDSDFIEIICLHTTFDYEVP